MQRYIGLDVHAASTTFAVIGESGKRLGSHVVETNGQALVEQLKTIPGKRHVVFEEGTQSGWLYEILSPHAEEIVVAMVSESRGQKSDERDAFRLAEQLRTGAIKTRVFKEVGEYKTLGELGRTHSMIVQDVVRVQNRIKALLRSRGVAVAGKSVYSEQGRGEFLEKLPNASRAAATMLYAQYDAVEAVRRRAEKGLVAEAHRHPMSRVLESCPGLGPIRVAQMMPIVVSPARFRTKRQFWSYCGLGIVMRSTSDWIQIKEGGWRRAEVQKTRGLNLNHNHTLKNVFKGAATTVITQLPNEPLHQDYQRLIDAGTKPNLAKLTMARKIAAIALSMWKSKEKYDPTKHRKQG
ncbi:IS110 family transposase [Sorangium sp. So ce887]|uniref:IS110 family transposase n=1 Tax=Sorangium sp. So ce887 TaxID=3133324 RepID=UPI003F5E5790